MEMAQRGADIVVLDPQDDGFSLTADVQALGHRLVYVPGDVSSRADCERAASARLKPSAASTSW